MRRKQIIYPVILCFVTIACLALVSVVPVWAQSKPMLTIWGKELDVANILPEYPRPQMQRNEWLNLNGEWELELGNVSTVSMPHPAETNNKRTILVPFPIGSTLSKVPDQVDRATYRRCFKIPDAWAKNSRIILHFGAVDWEASVSVNGRLMGIHRGGYDPFSFDITDALIFGGEQMLTVVVYDPGEQGTQPRGGQASRPKQGQHQCVTGIWQTVWLEPVPQTSIRELQVAPHFDNKTVTVQITGDHVNDHHIVLAELYDGDAFVTNAYGGVDGGIILRIPNDKMKPWSPESPTLYTVRVAIFDNDQLIDYVESYVGIRKIEIVPTSTGRATIYLNGKPYFQNGVVEHGVWPDGLYTAPSDLAVQSDLQIAKAFGFNMIRKTGKIDTQRWYYWCDKYGLLVWQEIPAAGNISAQATGQFDTELSAIIKSLQNHPSVIAWVLFQNQQGEHNPSYYANKILKTDPTRLLCASSNNVNQNVGNVRDMFFLPQPVSLLSQSTMTQTIGKYGGTCMFMPSNSWGTNTPSDFKEVNNVEDMVADVQKWVDTIAVTASQYDVSVAAYHQLVDLETETNGLVTYDREFLKVPIKTINEILKKFD